MMPSWEQPEAVLPAVLGLDLVLVRTDEVCVTVPTLGAYETGFELEMSVRLRSDAGEALGWAMHPMGPRPLWVGVEHIFRFAVLYADGRAAVNLEEAPFVRAGGSGVTMRQRDGGTGRRDASLRWYVQPLPPPGPLTFVCEWPAYAVAETRVEIDAAPLLEASGRALRLWPEPTPYGGVVSSLMLSTDGDDPTQS